MRAAYALTVVSLLFAAMLSATTPASPPLLTENQKSTQALARSIRYEAVVSAARDTAIKRYESASPALLADGKARLERAVEETVFDALLSAVNDPTQPKVTWIEGGDPNRIYRTIAVDSAHQYEIRGLRRSQASLDFNFEATLAPALWGKALAVLPAKDIDIGTDGSFSVIADATPAAGRRNHLQLPPGTVYILARDTLGDWSSELPDQLTVKRIDATSATARTRGELVNQAAQSVAQTVDETLKLLNNVWRNPPNQLHPFVRGAQFGITGGVLAIDRFELEDGEALLITLDPITAKYLGIQVTDPWMRSVDYQHRTTSFSNLQAKANTDGSFTYVLALRDPGVQNWLDADGLHKGLLLIRWELLSAPPQVDEAVRRVRTVKLSELAALLPHGTQQVSPAERRQELSARSAEYALRLVQK